jgi:ribosomal protein S18 acetylase RimI-like enzyme
VEMIIREATARDYDGLCAIISEVDKLHRDNLPWMFQEPDGPARDRDFILGSIADEAVSIFVAETEGQLVGFVHILVREALDIPIFVPRRYAVVDNLAVKEEFRQKGIGRALMNEAHDWAVAKGADTVKLNVYEFNESALAFYRRLGYKSVSRKMCISLR